jgi:hypothetical protein
MTVVPSRGFIDNSSVMPLTAALTILRIANLQRTGHRAVLGSCRSELSTIPDR